MNLSKREMRLAPLALLIILLGISYFMGSARIKAWGDAQKEIEVLENKKLKLNRSLRRKPLLEKKLKVLMEQLPVHPQDKSLTSEHQQKIQKLADEAKLKLRTMKSNEEEQIGSLDLYEMAVSCQWEGNLNSLIKFLFSLQSRGSVMNVENMNMQVLSARQPDLLKGNFLVNLAYSRSSEK